MAVHTDTTRRQILASAAALLLPLPALAAPPAASAPDLQTQGETFVRIPQLVRYFEERGAVFSACGQPGWYQVVWSDPDLSDEPIRWAASVDDRGEDLFYVRTFRAKVEGWDKF